MTIVRFGAVAAAVGAVLVVAGCANGPGPATPPTPVETGVPTRATTVPAAVPPAPDAAVTLVGESASVELEPATERALEDAQIEWRTEQPTLGQLPGWSDGHDTLHLPIRTGLVAPAATPPRGRVETDGSATFGRNGTSVSFSDLVVGLDASRVFASVDGRPVAMVDLELSRARLEVTPHLPPTIVDISGRLSDEALREIGRRLGAAPDPEDARVALELRLRSE